MAAGSGAVPSLYLPLRAWIRAMLAVFFRRIQVVGEELLPPSGPLLLVGNHPNSLLDPAILLASSARPVAFAAKDALFAVPVLGAILRGVGAIPIRRRVEADGDARAGAQADAPATVDNAEAFAAMAAYLGAGGVIGIFPEGCSYEATQLQPLKTGAARLALAAAAAHPTAGLQIVPVGLNYVAPRRFRSCVLVRHGPPLAIDATWVARWQAEPRGTARALTDEIDKALRALTIQADDWPTLRVLETVRRLYQPPGLSLEARLELSRRFAAGYARVREHPEIVKLFVRVAAFRARLDAIDLQERDLGHSWGAWDVLARFWRRTGPALLWLPLALPGLALHGPALLLAAWVGARVSPRPDVLATTRLLVGVVGVLVTWAAAAFALAAQLGPQAALALPALPLSGWAALRVMQRYADGREVAVSLVGFWRFRREVAALRRERRALEAAVVGAVVRHLPPDMQPLFLDASRARLGQGGDLPADGAAGWDDDSEIASAALDAAGIGRGSEAEFLTAFADLLAEDRT